MKKFYFSLVIALCAVLGAFAQNDPTKETVIVEPFTVNQASYADVTKNLRGAVMSGFSNVGRFFVVDALSDSRLSALFQNRKYEDVVTDQNWKTESGNAYKALNAKRLLKGQVELVKEYTKRDEEGKLWYYTDVNFTLQVFNIEDGSMVGSDSFNYSELSLSSYVDAFNDVLHKSEKDMTQFCNKFFKVESYVLDLGATDKKGNLADLWVSGGSNVGVSKGSIFLVFVDKKIGPKTTRVQIGQVVAEEVTADMTRCKVTKKEEGAAMSAAFTEGKTLYVELDRKRGDGIKELGRMFGF